MRPLAELRFILARVVEHVKAHPATEPLLDMLPKAAVPRLTWNSCKRGHDEWVERGRQWKCAACDRLGQQRRRALRVVR